VRHDGKGARCAGPSHDLPLSSRPAPVQRITPHGLHTLLRLLK